MKKSVAKGNEIEGVVYALYIGNFYSISSSWSYNRYFKKSNSCYSCYLANNIANEILAMVIKKFNYTEVSIMASLVKIDEQVKYAMNEVKTYPKGYEFEITDILSASRCIGASNWISFKLKLQTELMKECNAIGYGKFRKR